MNEGRRRWLVPALAAITLLGAALRFPTLGIQSYWHDEVFTAWLASKPFREMLDGVRATESSPPGYYVVAWLWAKVFGTSELGLRSLSALAGTLTIPTAYATAATLVSRRVGLLTAALAGTSPILVWYSQEARTYSLMVLASAVSLFFLARALRRLTATSLIGWTVFSIAAIAFHYFAAFAVIAEAGALLVLRGPKRAVLGAVAAVAAGGGLLLPLMWQQSDRAPWIRDISLDFRVEETLRQLVTPSPPSPWTGAGRAGLDSHELWWLGAVVLAAALVVAIRFGTPTARRGVLVAFGIGSATLLLPLVAGAAGERIAGRGDFFLERNLLSAWLPLAIVVAGLGVPRAGLIGAGAIAALCAAGVAIVLAIDANPSWQRDDWRLISRELGVGSRAVIVVPAYQATPLSFYESSLGAAPAAGARVREVDLVYRTGASREDARVPTVFDEVAVERVRRWEIHRLRAPSSTLVPAQPGLLFRPDGAR